MRLFEFTLELSDGTLVTQAVLAERWRWSQAFSQACSIVEATFRLQPWSGIRCVSYVSTPAAEIVPLQASTEPRHFQEVA